MTVREEALGALHVVLEAVTGPTVLRNAALPERMPASGLVILRDGRTGSA